MLLRAATSKRMSDEMIAQAHEDLRRLPADAIPYRRRMLEAQTMLHRDWLRWNERRYALMAGWEEWFETCDLLLCPAASSPAFPHDQAGERHDRTVTVNGKAQSRPVAAIGADRFGSSTRSALFTRNAARNGESVRDAGWTCGFRKANSVAVPSNAMTEFMSMPASL